MSNPTGPDEDATPAAEESAPEEPGEQPTEAISTGEPEPEFDSGQPTDVLPGTEQTTERRYSAPSGFDVRTTEVIRTTPEPETDVMSVPGGPPESPGQTAAAAVSRPRPVAPQAIPPRPLARRSWGLLLALILVIAALAAVAVLGTVLLTRKKSAGMSQEEQVRQTIQEFDVAIQKGDLATLRSITCGSTRDSYVNYPDDEWNTTYPKVAAAKQYPVVASIDEVVVNNDQHAEANVTAFVAYQPQVRSTRSFDLQFHDGRWKICDGPINLPR